ncbi:phage tail assembly chaperone [Sphingomonas azotifigens]|uniref:phage tail assembly chaperone n=1 Tax=Sphingomonas azotifigens TaxID=330920 RepID=UPI0009FF163B|nr:phage tail assembly chaperone [Sphingomonas azotifigens]
MMRFADAAQRLAGLAGLAFGWSPDRFWRATPAELAALVAAAGGDAGAPPTPDLIARLQEQFPDG